MLSLEQLRQPMKRSEIAAWLIQTLRDLGFQTTGWQPGRNQTTILNAIATVGASLSQVAVTFARANYSETATGPGLTLLSRSRFSNERESALQATGPMLFQSTATSAHTIQVGQLVIESASTGVQFGNTTGGVLSAGGTLTLTVEALASGLSGNVANSTGLFLVTPLAGVGVTNPGPGLGVAWYTTQAGRNAELDSELRLRNSTKWGLLAVEKTKTAMIALALEQDGVAKASVVDNNPRGPFTVDIYISAAASIVSAGQIAAAQAAFATYTMGTESVWPPTDTPLPSSVRLYHPPTLQLTINGVVYYDPQFTEADIEIELGNRLDALVEITPLGGNTYATGAENLLTLGDILQVIEETRGVLSTTLTLPAGNVALSPTTLVIPPAAGWFVGLNLVPGVT